VTVPRKKHLQRRRRPERDVLAAVFDLQIGPPPRLGYVPPWAEEDELRELTECALALGLIDENAWAIRELAHPAGLAK
jgi:hypothetical protein